MAYKSFEMPEHLKQKLSANESGRFPWVYLDGVSPECLAFALGRIGHIELADVIIRLSNHKGDLTVGSTRALKLHERKAFEEAWSSIHYECNVYFVSLDTTDATPTPWNGEKEDLRLFVTGKIEA